jgi:lysozyme family protein
MSSRFDKFLVKTFGHEGGFSNHPSDKGGKTKYGITQVTARAYGYNGAMEQLTREEARDIYLKGYYNPLYDSINSDLLAFKLFDFGVNCGIATAVRRLQIVLARNVLTDPKYQIKTDGNFGPITLWNLNKRIADNGEKAVGQEYIQIMMQYYEDLVKTKPTQRVFLNGWLNRARSIPKFEVA